MKNKKPMQVLVVLLAVIFMATAVQASEKNYKHSWYNPFAGIWKKISDLNGNVKKMDRKINRMDRKINKLQVSGMAGPPGPKGDKGDPGPAGPQGSPGANARFICPGCNFSESEEWGNQNTDIQFTSLKKEEPSANNLFTGAYLANSRFDYSNFSGVSFSGANLHNADFYNSNLSNADFSYTNLKNVIFTGSDLTGADFTGANYEGVIWWEPGFTSLGWKPTICPDGTTADTIGNTCVNNLR